MKRTITIIFLLQFFFFSSSYSKEFKSSHGFSFNLKDTYNHLVHINVDELELLVQNLVQNSKDENTRKFSEQFSKYKHLLSNYNIEYLWDLERYSFYESINIMRVDVEKAFKNKNIDNINIVKICEKITDQNNKRYDINQKIFACLWLEVPKNTKWSFVREVSGIKFGKTLQVQFQHNDDQIIITAVCQNQYCDSVRHDLLTITESIKFD